MIPLMIPNMAGNEALYLKECIDSNFVSTVGPFVTRFEKEVARHAVSSYAVATDTGTSALHTALLAVGVGRDDLVIVPSFTFIASANAVAHCGAIPWLLDVSPDSWTLDPLLLEKCLHNETQIKNDKLVHVASGRKVAAILPVYALGLPADMNPIRSVAQEFKLPIVADAAAALGAIYRNKAIGHLANLTVFSFNGNKTFTAGGGGAITGNDEKLIQLARHLSTTARISADYQHDRVGYNYRMTNLQAAVGCAQLESMKDFISAKRRIRRVYDNELGSIPGIKPFPNPSWAESACWFSGVQIDSPTLPKVSEICEKLKAQGIESRPFWRPVHLQTPYLSSPRSDQNVCESFWNKILTLPCSTSITTGEIETVIKTVKEVLS